MKILRCKDYGFDCPAEFRGATVEDLLDQAKKHAMKSHNMTAEQVNAPEIRKVAEEKSRDI